MYYILGSNLSTRKYQSLLTKSQTRNTSTSKNIGQQNILITLKIKNTFTSRHDIYWIMPTVRIMLSFQQGKGLLHEGNEEATRLETHTYCYTEVLDHPSKHSGYGASVFWKKSYENDLPWIIFASVSSFFVSLSEAKHINVIPTANLKKSIMTECHIKQYG